MAVGHAYKKDAQPQFLLLFNSPFFLWCERRPSSPKSRNGLWGVLLCAIDRVGQNMACYFCTTIVWFPSTIVEIFIHLAVCLTTGPKPLPNRALHIVRSRASSFNCEYSLLSLRSSGSFLRLLPRLPLTSIPPFMFPSITRCRRQFLRRMWPIQFAFRFLISSTAPWLSVILLHFSHNRSNWSSRNMYFVKQLAHTSFRNTYRLILRYNEAFICRK